MKTNKGKDISIAKTPSALVIRGRFHEEEEKKKERRKEE